VAKNLEPIAFDLAALDGELRALGAFLKSKADLSEKKDIQPFFKARKHLSAFLGTFSPAVGPATELAFEFPFFGDFSADVLLGNKKAGEFCVVEFEDGRRDSLFKRQPARGNPEWSARFEHGFSQFVDWFYHLDDFKGTKGFAKTFGNGHVRFTGLLIVGRGAGLDDAQRARLRWRTERVLVDSHPINCLTFDDLHALLHERFMLYRTGSKLGEKEKK
jgi:hypothetical protein